MNDLELIENYLTGQLPADERARFEAALRTDPAVADTLAFYLMAKQAARAEAREQRLAELNALRRKTPQPPVMEPVGLPRARPSWSAPMRWAAAASVVLLLGLGWYFFRPQPQPMLAASQQVDAYVTSHFMQLPTTMDGGPADSLKMGVDLFNKGNVAEANTVFQDVLTRHPNTDSALKYAGIVAFRRGDYDQAITLFHRLSQRTDLYANPGLFYESLALLKRGRPMDKNEAKKLLEDVIKNNLDGKTEAEQLKTSL